MHEIGTVIKNETIREGLHVFNLNKNLNNYKQQWKQDSERMSDPRQAKQVWKYNPIGHRRVVRLRIFEGGTGGTLPVPYCEDDDDDEIFSQW